PLSADYFGAFAERISELLEVGDANPPFVGIMSNGTSGNINNVNFAGPSPGIRRPGEQIRVVADSVAKAAIAAYRRIEHRDWVPPAMAEKETELGVRLPSKDDVVRAKTILAAAKDGLKTQPEIYARETVLLAEYPPTMKLKLQAIRVGELGIAAV